MGNVATGNNLDLQALKLTMKSNKGNQAAQSPQLNLQAYQAYQSILAANVQQANADNLFLSQITRVSDPGPNLFDVFNQQSGMYLQTFASTNMFDNFMSQNLNSNPFGNYIPNNNNLSLDLLNLNAKTKPQPVKNNPKDDVLLELLKLDVKQKEETPKVELKPIENVGGRRFAQAEGDPHISFGAQETADPERFDFMEGGIFTLLSDKDSTINGECTQFKDGTAITKLGCVFGNEKVTIDVNGNVTLNGQPAMEQGGELALKNGSKIVKDDRGYTISTPEYSTAVWFDKGKFININIGTGAQGVGLDGILPTGLLGESFTRNAEGNYTTDKSGAKYKVNDLFAIPESISKLTGQTNANNDLLNTNNDDWLTNLLNTGTTAKTTENTGTTAEAASTQTSDDLTAFIKLLFTELLKMFGLDGLGTLA